MRNTLAFVAALVVVVAGLGWYLGWYQVFVKPGQDGHQSVKIDIDTKKVGEDLKKGEKKLQELKDAGKAEHGAKKGTEGSASSGLQPPSLLEEQEVPPLPTPFGGPAGRK